LFTLAGDLRGQGDTLGNLGGVHLLLGQFDRALDYYSRALEISEELDSRVGMTIDHGNLGLALSGLGRIEEALWHFDLALELADEAGLAQEKAYWLRGKASVLILQGRYEEGLNNYREALKAYEESGARLLLLDALTDLGALMMILGDVPTAESLFQRSVDLARQMGQQQAISVNMLALGDIRFARGQMNEARALYRQVMSRTKASGEQAFNADSLLRLARLDLHERHLDAAEASAQHALEIGLETGASGRVAEAWYTLGQLALSHEDFNRAIIAFDKSALTVGNEGDPDLLWRLYYGRALAMEMSGDRHSAVRELKRAIAVIESVRDRLREERFRAGWVESRYQVYIDLVRLQIELGQTLDAFSTAERLRARSFLAQIERISPVARDPEDRRQEARLRSRVRQLRQALVTEQSRSSAERRQPTIELFSTELIQAEHEYQAALDRRISAGYAMGETPPLSELQSRLGPNEALLEYIVAEHEIYIFLVGPERLVATSRKVEREALRARVEFLRELIQQPDNELWRKPAAGLSGELIEPLAEQGLLDGVTHLTIIPHGILHYLPFAVLPVRPSASQLLVDAYSLSYLPSAANMMQEPRLAAASALLAMAPERSRLQYAPEEARKVAGMFGDQADLLLGPAATESAFKSGSAEYRVLHFATHGFFNRHNPLLSGLELEADMRNDGRLEVHEILGLRLQSDLVTLSACQTGLGSGWFSDFPAGDDFVSLTRAFLAAGSRSVLASLWEVDDRSTGSLMAGFYRELGSGPGDAYADALAEIQRDLKTSRNFHHPFYWAPFVLVGHGGSASPALSKRG
jgi:CHAT domain-containing protein/TolA-binding protein